MIDLQIKVSEAEQNKDVTIVDLIGSVDAHTVPELDSGLRKLVQDNKYKIILNMEKLDYICSTGLGAIMGVVGELEDFNGEIVCLKVGKKVSKIFDLLGFSSFFKIFDNLEEAVASFE